MYVQKHKGPSLTLVIFGVVVAVGLWLGLIVGWLMNLYWLFTQAEGTDAQFWIALFGTFVPPVGAIHGWVTIF